MSEAEDTLKRLMQLPGVQGVIVINQDGIPIRTTIQQPKTAHIVGLLHGFILKSKSMIKEMDNLNDLTFIRLRSQKDEILIAPDREFTMIVIQKPVTNKR